MSEEEINEIVKEHYGFTIDEMDEDVGRLAFKVKELEDRINKAVEYIENHSLYDEEYDYNYEEEMYLSGIDDEVAKKDLLYLLKGDKEVNK